MSVRAVITGSLGRSVFDFCRECMEMDDEFIKQKLARFAAPGAEESKELAGINSMADTQTAFISGAIAESMKRSDFRFRDLKRKPGTTVYICLPLNKLDVCNKYFSLILACMLSELLDEGMRGGAPVLAIIDEAAQTGYLKALDDAWGMAAGACGLQILAVYQSVVQIMQQFSRSWQNVIANCGVTMWFASRDQQTRQTVSDLAGVTSVLTHSRGITEPRRNGMWKIKPQISDNISQASRPLLHPDEVGRLDPGTMLLFCEGVPGVVKAVRKPYLDAFRGQYRDNPYYTKGKL